VAAVGDIVVAADMFAVAAVIEFVEEEAVAFEVAAAVVVV